MKSMRTVAAAALAAAVVGAGAAVPAGAAAPSTPFEKAIAKRNAKIERLERQMATYQGAIARRNARVDALVKQTTDLTAERDAANRKLADLPGQIRALTAQSAFDLLSVIAERLRGTAPFEVTRREVPRIDRAPVVIWTFQDGTFITPGPPDPGPPFP